MSEKTLCIYHGNCADGFGAAWVVRKALGDGVEFHAGVYQTPPPDVTDRDVILVDFSYKRPVLEDMASKALSVLVLDHHKTAQEDLADFPQHPQPERRDKSTRYSPNTLTSYARLWGIPPLFAEFDMERSGAGLTWDFFFPDDPRPPLIDHIEDRDLWRFRLEGTREIQAALFSYPYDFTVWEAFMSLDDLDRLHCEGQAIERKHFKDIAELLKVCQRRMVIAGIDVPVASLPYTLTSDAGHKMATDDPSKIGVCYWDTERGRVFSLRSTDDGPDVSAIAKQYGGGGHAHAAGFEVPRDHELARN